MGQVFRARKRGGAFPAPEAEADIPPFKKYPTAYIALDVDFTPHKLTLKEVESQPVPYILAQCHYRVVIDAGGREQRAYDLERSHMKQVLFMKPDKQFHLYGHLITNIERYGVEDEFLKLNKDWQW